jgi:hypothetical protein
MHEKVDGPRLFVAETAHFVERRQIDAAQLYAPVGMTDAQACLRLFAFALITTHEGDARAAFE